MTAKSWYKSNCTHDEAVPVFQAKGKKGTGGEVWAGAKTELMDERGWDLIISAVGFADFLKNPIAGNEEARQLLPEALFTFKPVPCIGIEWPDRGTPNLPREWWVMMAKVIRGMPKGSKVGLCCMGGHGRTGTMLAILAVLLGQVKKGKCPVAWVRKNYCKEAVESNSQADYVEEITGVMVAASPSDEQKLVYSTAPKAPSGGATASGVNPTGRSVEGTQVTPTLAGSSAGNVSTLNREPTDDELEDALKKGGGSITIEIEGCGHRQWSPVYEETDDNELVGWYEVSPKEEEDLTPEEMRSLWDGTGQQ